MSTVSINLASEYSLFKDSYRGGRARGYAEVINLAARNSSLSGVMMARPEADAQVKGDPESWNVFARTSGQTQSRAPKDPLEIDRNALTIKATAGLRIAVTPLPMVEYEHDIMDGGADADRFQTMADQEEADMLTDHFNFWDDQWLAIPDAAMESYDDKSAPSHSLAALLCPEYTGTFDDYTPTGIPGNFGSTTTLLNVVPGDVPNNRWRPVVSLYDPAAAFNVDTGVAEALGRAFDRVKFERLLMKGKAVPGTATTKTTDCGIVTGYNGKSVIRRIGLRGRESPDTDLGIDDVPYRGIVPIIASELDNKNLDYRGSYTDQYPKESPVFFLPCWRDIFVISHRKHTLRMLTKDMGARQYDMTVDILESWMALKARRRDTSAVVAPHND